MGLIPAKMSDILCEKVNLSWTDNIFCLLYLQSELIKPILICGRDQVPHSQEQKESCIHICIAYNESISNLECICYSFHSSYASKGEFSLVCIQTQNSNVCVSEYRSLFTCPIGQTLVQGMQIRIIVIWKLAILFGTNCILVGLFFLIVLNIP